MPTAQENYRNGGIIGILLGLFVSSFSNGWLTVSADPIAGKGLAQGYIFIIPVIAAIFFISSLFTKKLKLSPRNTGILAGFTGISTLLSFIVFSAPNLVNNVLTSLHK